MLKWCILIVKVWKEWSKRPVHEWEGDYAYYHNNWAKDPLHGVVADDVSVAHSSNSGAGPI